MVLSLLKSLVNEAGVPQDKITVFDASRFITDNIYNKCHAAFQGVIFVDNTGGDGRTKSVYVDNAIPYSVDNGKLATGLASCVVEADNPPSKAKYDPQRNNAKISSLGVFEHWNNVTEKKYSRNLGKNAGIELMMRSL